MANERNEQEIDDILAQLRKSMNASEKKSGSSAEKSSFDLEVEEKLRAQVMDPSKKKGASSFSVSYADNAADADTVDGTTSDEDFSVSELEIVKDGALHLVDEENPEEKGDDLSDWISRFTAEDDGNMDDEVDEPETVELTEEDEPTVDEDDAIDEENVSDTGIETEESDDVDAYETVREEDGLEPEAAEVLENYETDVLGKDDKAEDAEENDEIDDSEPDWEALMALMTPKQLAQFKQVMAEREAIITSEEKVTSEALEKSADEDETAEDAAEANAEVASTIEESEPAMESASETETSQISVPEISREIDKSDATTQEIAEKSDEDTAEKIGDNVLSAEKTSPSKGFALMDDAEDMPLIKVGQSERSTFSLMEEEPVESAEASDLKEANEQLVVPEDADDVQDADDAQEYERMIAALMAHMTPEQLKRFYQTAEEEGIVLPESAYSRENNNETLETDACGALKVEDVETDVESFTLTGGGPSPEHGDAKPVVNTEADNDNDAEDDGEPAILLHSDEMSDVDEDEFAEKVREDAEILHIAYETDEKAANASPEQTVEEGTAPEEALWQLLQDPEHLEALRARLSPEQQKQLQQMIDARNAECEEDDAPMLEPVSNDENETSRDRTEAAYAEGDDVPEPADIAPDMTDDDIMLMLGLGYEKELVERLGRDRIERVKKLSRHGEAPERAHAPAYGYNGREFRHREQIPEIQGRYKKAKRVMFVRLVGTSLFTVLLFLYEVCGLFRGVFGGIFDVAHYPVIAIMAGWQLLLLAAAFSLRPLLRGIRSVFKLEPDDHAMTSLVVTLVMLNDMLMPLFFKGSNLYLYNFPAAVCLVLSVLCDMARLWREAAAFEVVASTVPKYVGEAARVGGMAEADRDEKAEADTDRKEHAKNAILARRAGFVSGYFRRTTQKPRGRQILNFVFIPLIAVALVMSVITGIQGNDVATVLRAFLVTVLIGMPVSYDVLRAYAFYKVNRELTEKDCTIVGESSVEEYDRYRNVIFDDKELFPHSLIKTKGFKFNENNMIYAVILKISILFRGIGGPVNEVLDLDSEELKRFIATGEGAELAGGKITLDKVTEEGVEASLSDGSCVLAGSAAFLTQHGVAVRQTTKDLQLLQTGDMSILYLAFDGVLCARFYVDYQPDTEFENVANMLDDVGYHVYVRTLDPGIHEEMIHHKCFEDTAAISVVRASVASLSSAGGGETARVNSGIVAGGNQKKLALPLRAVRRLSRLFRFGTRFYGVLVGINMLVATVLTACNMIGRMATWAVALYMVVWAATALVITRYYDR